MLESGPRLLGALGAPRRKEKRTYCGAPGNCAALLEGLRTRHRDNEFYRLLERVLELEGIIPIVIDTPDAEGTLPLPHSGFTVVKVNGDYLEIVQRTRQRSSASTTTALMRCSGASSRSKSPRSSPPQIADSTHAPGERAKRHRLNCASSKPFNCASNGSGISWSSDTDRSSATSGS